MDIVITSMGTESLPQIEKLWEDLKEHHIEVSGAFSPVFRMASWESRRTEFERKAEKGKLKVDIVKNDDMIIGYGVSTITPNGIGELDSLCVKEQFRGHGIGKQLIKRALDWMEIEGATAQTITVVHGNEQAMSLYKSFGFSPIKHTLMMPPKP